jgi:tRNA nucleotidyltransferase (CCA-adding enzyme)
VAERFPLAEIPGQVREIALRLRAAGHEAWYVGGAVRDVYIRTLVGREVRRGDFDIATSARPEQVQALFRRTVPVGIEHGTIAVLDSDSRPHEVTTFRRDVKTDGRHAEVAFGVSLEEDLARRDFTINAIAVHPETGEVRDPFGGCADLTGHLVRAVGDPATRFREDRLRVLRALRFASAFDFAIEPATWAAVLGAVNDLAHLSRERVRDEWLRTLAGPLPVRGVALWRAAGALAAVWPELAALAPAAEAELEGMASPEPVLLTAALLVRAGASPAAAAAATLRLKFSNRDAGRVEGIVRAVSAGLPPAADAAAVRRWMARHRAVAADAAAAAPGTIDSREPLQAAVLAVLAAKSPLAIGDLAVRGEDLAAAGIAPGPRMGEVLRALLDAVLDDPARNTREDLLARARALA